MVDSFIDSILNLYKEKNWKTIVSQYHDHPERSKLLWVFPTEDNFQFLKHCVEKFGCASILSIGCGSGLLEWMITESTGLPTFGVEVDGAWWHSKYAPPAFIPLIITATTLDADMVQKLENCQSTALMFCYFNNGPAFARYLEHFSGKVIIIIGPGYCKGVHTDPRPFGDLNNGWILYGSQEVRDSEDFIAVYHKNCPEIIELLR